MEDLEHRNSSDSDGAHIHDLPDEVLLLILRRLEDAKSLCRCYLVSKRFASLIPHIHNVIFSIPDPDSSPINSYSNPSISDNNGETQKNFPKNVLNLLSKPFHYLRQITGGPSLPSPSSTPAFNSVAFVNGIRFLKKFREIQRLEIQTPCFHAQDPSLLKWEAGLGKDSIFCVSLFSSSSSSDNDDFSDELLAENGGGDLNNPEAFALTNEMLRDRVEIAYQCFMEALWRRHVLRHVVADHHKTLEEARFTDQKGNGKVYLRKEQVANLQDLRAKEPVDLRAAEAGYMKVWHVSEDGGVDRGFRGRRRRKWRRWR
ncbi:PREDICTED: F-box protein At1g30200-like isoform X2 [Ipomoea nil]|uniref:F-box protein At1g30200-like isoform X2 n=1 Tax=Ipomoea nil TaxID=35883 RepID=UPI000901E4DA|nr:PREDICTED: F-box protein At1g30200-like isoform X2 [Ipomoea nil]